MLGSGAGVMLEAVMPRNGAAVAIAHLLASTEQSESDPVSRLLNQLEQLMPPSAWTALFLGVFALLFLLNIGNQLSGILSWLEVPSPFQRSQTATDQIEHTRQKLLKIVKKEVNLRLANSLHNLVKLDLYMEDQRQRVGRPKLGLIPEDPLEDTEPSFQVINRVLHPKGDSPALDLKLTQKIIEVFGRQDIQGRLLILGEPGSGKTTELLQLAQNLLTRVEEDRKHPVPVLLELSSWNGESIDKWVASQLDKLYSLSKNTTQQWLADNQIIFLLDGLDELGLTKQRQCIEKINQFLEITHISELIVCCRREEYEAGEIELNGLNGAVYLEALREEQIREYFEKLNRLSLWENVCGNLTLLKLAQKPLFLFMLIVAYQGNPIRNEQELFDAYIEKQLHEPGNQGVDKKGKEPTPHQTRHYLAWLAKQLEAISETEFLIEGLQPNWLSSAKQKKFYKRSINIGTILSLGLSLVLSGNLYILLLGLLFVGVNFGLIGRSDVELIQPKEKLQWSFRQGLSAGLGVGLFFGLSMGLMTLLVIRLSVGLIDMLIGVLGSGLMSGLGTGLIVWVIGGFSDVLIKEKEFPNQGIRRGIQNTLGIGLSFGLIGGLIGSLFGGPSIGLRIGLVVGLIGGLIGGLEAIIKHLILRILLTKEGSTPWNYARFLDHAVKHRFIQRTGGRYRFVHDLLRKHFAAMPLE